MTAVKRMWPKRVFYALAFSFLAVLCLLVLFYGYLRFTAAEANSLPALQDGDLVFNTSPARQSLPIMIATQSPLTHMGIVRLDQNGQPFVLEASYTVRETPLQEWIDIGVGGRLQVMRLKETPDAQELQKAFDWIEKQMGKPYDIFFTNGHDRFYCSELVYDALRNKAGVTIGQVQKVGELKLDSAPVQKLIAARWQKYPLCRAQGITDFEACFAIIKQQNLITPASMAADDKLATVYSNY